jgi:hypothetical protein
MPTVSNDTTKPEPLRRDNSHDEAGNPRDKPRELVKDICDDPQNFYPGFMPRGRR